jgi:DnaJ-class molecular chaperone
MIYQNLTMRYHTDVCKNCYNYGFFDPDEMISICPVCSGTGQIQQIIVEKEIANKNYEETYHASNRARETNRPMDDEG